MKQAALLDKLIQGAKQSNAGLRRLNFAMLRAIPFNLPHKLKVREVSEERIVTDLPYRRKNLNHLKGIHACAIATLAEYTSGLFLLSKARSGSYRIIMKRIEMDYHYQAKMGVRASFVLSEEEYQTKVMKVLEAEGILQDYFTVEIHDTEGNHIATGRVQWQLKAWDKVKTKM